MSHLARRIGIALINTGIDPRKLILSILGLPKFLRDLFAFASQRQRAEHKLPISLLPLLTDHVSSSVKPNKHYFVQDIWAARRVFRLAPVKHVDVGSRVDGFVAHVASFREIEVLDIRAVSAPIKGISFQKADLLNLPSYLNQYCDCLSCLHVIEHVGLGRYGDSVDVDGHLKAIGALAYLLKTDGVLLLSSPVGRERVEFNAHRVLDPETIVKTAKSSGLQLIDFSMIDDDDRLIESVDIARAQSQEYACGLFEFRKT